MSKTFARPSISKSVSLRNAVFAYVSACCSVLADKPSCKDTAGALGKWRCSSCKKRCKVSPADKTKYLPVGNAKVKPVQGEKAL
jgi:hypothetical protein